jgi:uncharacterized phage-associated protein
MCKFSESNRRKLGNAVSYIAANASFPYKTEVLKLLFLMEERMVKQYHVPFLGIPFSTWRMGPVSVDVFEELSDGPVLLADFIALEFNGQGIKVTSKQAFCDDEFSDNEIKMMEDVMSEYGWMNSEQLIAETNKEGSLSHQTAQEEGLLDDFELKRANSSIVVIDMVRRLNDADRAFYEDTLNIRESANLMRLEREIGRSRA